MTNEEAIKVLRTIIDNSVEMTIREWEEFDKKVLKAVDMAIEALSSNAKGDLISRQWLLEVYGDYIGDNGEPKYHVPLEVVRQNIKDAPPADAVHIETYRELYEKYMELKHASTEVVQGEWKHTITGQPYCSNCEYVFGEDEEFNPFWDYCPMCGIRIKGGVE